MKIIHKLSILLLTLIFACQNEKIEMFDQEIIEGKISAVVPGHTAMIYIQNPTKTIGIKIPFKYEKRWKVGDSCVFIIQKYKVKE